MDVERRGSFFLLLFRISLPGLSGWWRVESGLPDLAKGRRAIPIRFAEMDALLPEPDEIHDRVHVYTAWHREAVGDSIWANRPQFFIVAWICRAAGASGWNFDDAGSVHASSRLHPFRTDGGRLLGQVGTERLLAESDRRGSVNLLLFCLPVDVGHRRWSVERRPSLKPRAASRVKRPKRHGGREKRGFDLNVDVKWVRDSVGDKGAAPMPPSESRTI